MQLDGSLGEYNVKWAVLSLFGIDMQLHAQ